MMELRQRHSNRSYVSLSMSFRKSLFSFKLIFCHSRIARYITDIFYYFFNYLPLIAVLIGTSKIVAG